VILIPANCTDRLQPLDISVNKAAKEFLRKQFHQWYAKQVCAQLEQKEANRPSSKCCEAVRGTMDGGDVRLFKE